MTDTVQVEDSFTGSSGTALASHTPDTVASGSASYSTTDFQLNGSGGVRLTTLSYGATPSIFLNLTAVHVIAGLYFEFDIIMGQYAGSGTAPSAWSVTCNTTELALPFIGYNRSTGILSLGSHDMSMPYATGNSVTVRVEIDQYAQTTTYYLNGVSTFTEDDSTWYLGTETWADDSFGYRLTPYNESGFSVAGGTVQNVIDRIELGTLGLSGGGPTPVFWTALRGAVEYP